MHLTITSTKENPLLHRKDVVASMSFEKQTPSHLDVKKGLAEHLKVPPEQVIVTAIDTAFGFQQASVNAHVYSDLTSLKRNEPKYLVNRDSADRKKKGAPDAAPAAKEEAKKGA
ncbi:MAG: hypothetical protein V1735_02440 [Nanoarchaeota archaeon]